MVKRLTLIVFMLMISISSVFSSNISIETQVGYLSEVVGFALTKDNFTSKVDNIQTAISLGETIKLNTDKDFNYVFSINYRISNKAKIIEKNESLKDTPLTSEFYQNSLYLFLGVERVFALANNFSLNLVTGIDSMYYFENKSEYYKPFVDTSKSSNLSFGIVSSVNLNYQIFNDMKISLGLNALYNPIVISEKFISVKEFADSNDSKFTANIQSINPTIGFVYSY